MISTRSAEGRQIGLSYVGVPEYARDTPQGVSVDICNRAVAAELARDRFWYETSETGRLRGRYLDYVREYWAFNELDELASTDNRASLRRLQQSTSAELATEHYGQNVGPRLVWLIMPLREWMNVAAELDEMAAGEFEPGEGLLVESLLTRVIDVHESPKALDSVAWTPTSVHNSEPVAQAGGGLTLRDFPKHAPTRAESDELIDKLEAVEKARSTETRVAVLFINTPQALKAAVATLRGFDPDTPANAVWASSFAHVLRAQVLESANAPHASTYYDLFGVEEMEGTAPEAVEVAELEPRPVIDPAKRTASFTGEELREAGEAGIPLEPETRPTDFDDQPDSVKADDSAFIDQNDGGQPDKPRVLDESDGDAVESYVGDDTTAGQ